MLATFQFKELVDRAILEDVGAGDLSAGLLPEEMIGEAKIYAKEEGIVAGLEIARYIFESIDPRIRSELLCKDGDSVNLGTVVVHLTGPLGSILTGERTALNFLQHLSGIATATQRVVAELGGLPVKIVDTRKTLPGLRVLQKYAVRVGGGFNHRYGLYDAVLLKDNHIAAAGGLAKAIQMAKERIGHMVKIEVECETLTQVQEALEASVDVIMLDNMNIREMGEAVKLVNRRAVVEASGGIKAGRIREVAETGVDVISIGALTNSVKALDFSLDVGDIKASTRARWAKGE